MCEPSDNVLRAEIALIFTDDIDLTITTSKKIRQQVERKLNVDLTERRRDFDDLVLEGLKEYRARQRRLEAASEKSTEEEEEGEIEEAEVTEKEEAKATEKLEEKVKEEGKRRTGKKKNIKRMRRRRRKRKNRGSGREGGQADKGR